jgi:hypothetical protein
MRPRMRAPQLAARAASTGAPDCDASAGAPDRGGAVHAHRPVWNGNPRRAHKTIFRLCNRYLPMLCNGHLPKVTERDPDFYKCPKLEKWYKNIAQDDPKRHKEGPVPPTWGAGGRRQWSLTRSFMWSVGPPVRSAVLAGVVVPTGLLGLCGSVRVRSH